ncbi:hypothetical protein OH77DRAFT_1108666 [Trametes cingulata]|nr:hypothetical protein OH77DRAFT_1108666 [Trametes cingulata]
MASSGTGQTTRRHTIRLTYTVPSFLEGVREFRVLQLGWPGSRAAVLDRVGQTIKVDEGVLCRELRSHSLRLPSVRGAVETWFENYSVEAMLFPHLRLAAEGYNNRRTYVWRRKDGSSACRLRIISTTSSALTAPSPGMDWLRVDDAFLRWPHIPYSRI